MPARSPPMSSRSRLPTCVWIAQTHLAGMYCHHYKHIWQACQQHDNPTCIHLKKVWHSNNKGQCALNRRQVSLQIVLKGLTLYLRYRLCSLLVCAMTYQGTHTATCIAAALVAHMYQITCIHLLGMCSAEAYAHASSTASKHSCSFQLTTSTCIKQLRSTPV